MRFFLSSKKRMDLLESWRISKVAPLVEGRLLDVGCGFNNLVTRYGSGVGVDIYPWDGINVQIGDSALLPFPDACFDTATIVAALNHIPDRAETLLEIRRVLRSDGRLIVTMIGPKTGILAHLLFHQDENVRGGIEPGEKKGMVWPEVIDLLEKSGFTIKQQIPFQLGLNRVFVATKKEENKIG